MSEIVVTTSNSFVLNMFLLITESFGLSWSILEIVTSTETGFPPKS